MKKMIWLVILVAVVAVVLISVFVVQRDSLSAQVTQLQADKEDLNKQLQEVDMAVKTAQELAETMVRETEEKLAAVTVERDQLQASAESASAQLNEGIVQLKSALAALGVSDQDTLMAAELQETKDALTTVTQERDALVKAVESAKVEKASVLITNAEGETVQELEDANQLKLADLPAGDYVISMIIYTADSSEAARYSFPYSASLPAAEEPAEEPADNAEEPKETVEEPEETAGEPEEAAEGTEEAVKEETAQEPAEAVEEPAEGIEETTAETEAAAEGAEKTSAEEDMNGEESEQSSEEVTDEKLPDSAG